MAYYDIVPVIFIELSNITSMKVHLRRSKFAELLGSTSLSSTYTQSPQCCLGKGPTAGHDKGRPQVILFHVPGVMEIYFHKNCASSYIELIYS